MKTIALKNADGDTIEIKEGPARKFLVRHSKFDKQAFGEFDDGHPERMDTATFREAMAKKGVNMDSELGKQARENFKAALGAWLLLPAGNETLSIADGDMIREAIKGFSA